MKTKIIALILTVLLLAGILSGCGKAAVSFPVTVEGAIFGGKADDRIDTALNFDAKWLTKGDNEKYSKDLAAFSALISADVYFRAKDVDKGTQNRVLFDGEKAEEYDWTALLKHLGFSDVEYIESYKAKEYTADTNDSATMTMGYMSSDNKYDVYVIALRGCFSAQEWMSIFDPGSAGESYTSYTGAHEEWKNTDHFKGVDIAANRAKEFIDEFIASHDDPAKKNCILLTGHSRGGMLANLLGAEYEKNTNAKTFTYTFNTMGVTNDSAATSYKTIFNVFDANDFYTNVLPFKNEPFYRYGKNVTVSIADSDKVKDELSSLKGRDDYACTNAEALADYANMFGRRFADRASLYEKEILTETFSSEDEALARAEELRTLTGSESGLGLETFCVVNDAISNGDGTYSVSMEYCGAALLWGYCKTLAYGTDAYNAFKTIFSGDELGCEIADFLADNAAGITGGHALANSYVLAGIAG